MLDKYFTPDEIDKLVEIGPERIRKVYAKKAVCQCEDCREKHNNLYKHLEHDFYKDAQDYREQERIGQIVKGSEKYPEPFNPDSWSARELLQHAMQENIDQGHYIYGLFKKVEAMEQALKEIGAMDEVGFAPEYVVKRYAEFARNILKGEVNDDK